MREAERTVMLTNIDGFVRLAVISQNSHQILAGSFNVASDDSQSNQAFNWEVKAVRREVPRLDVSR